MQECDGLNSGETSCDGPPDDPPVDRQEFERLFVEIRPRLLSFCRRRTESLQRAEDLFQIVSERAWRSFATFRGEGRFLHWILRIARNELPRREPGLPSHRLKQPVSLSSLESILETNPGHPVIRDASSEIQHGSTLPPGVMRAVIPEAGSENFLSGLEVQVLLLRLDHPKSPLAELAPRLGITHQNFATINTRAYPKLLVYFLTNFARFFGSWDLVRQAFERAQSCPRDPLTAKESLTFENLVILRRTRWSLKGSKGILRSACSKVARHLWWMF